MSQKTWILLNPLKCISSTAPCLLNDKYVIIASDSNKGKIYSYDLEENKWFNIGKLGIEPLRHSIIVDNKKQIIYVYTNTATSTDKFFEIDILQRNNSCKMYKGIIHGLPQGLDGETGGYVELCQLNNIIHAIGGYSFAYHSIWINGERENKINRFIQCNIANRDKHQSLYGHSLITITALNQILILGGKENTMNMFGGYLKDIWLCQTNQNLNNYNYKWSKLNTTLPYKMCSFGCIKTLDEKYICIFGGKTASGLKDAIWILNTSNWKWKKSAIKCPKKSKYFAVLTSTNDIHLFAVDQDKHWKIQLSKIISSNSIPNSSEEKNVRQEAKMNENEDLESALLRLQEENTQLNKRLIDYVEQTSLLEEQKKELLNNQTKLQTEKDELQRKNMALIDECKELKFELNETRQKYKQLTKQIVSDVKNFRKWDDDNITDWIISLNEDYKKYEDVLRNKLKEESMTGDYLDELDKSDLDRFGIKSFKDKSVIMKHIKSLISQQQQQDEGATAFI